MFNYYHWSEISTIHSNVFWLDNIVAWEDSTFLLDSDVFAAFILTSFTFTSTYFSLLQSSLYSFLDSFIVISSRSSSSDTMLHLFYYDFTMFIYTMFLKQTFFLSTEFGDLFMMLLHTHPELLFTLNSFLTWCDNFVVEVTPTSVYDVFSFQISNNTLDFITYLKWLVIMLFSTLFIFSYVQSAQFGKLTPLMLRRIVLYFPTFSFENRMQLDWALFFLTFIFSIWLVVLMTYDDVNVEIIELFHYFVCLTFLFIIATLIYKYSVHYFSFLENSVSEGFTTSFIAKQFVRDVSNTFALFLRFFLLIFRLNIYDGLDDFLDSYYIFFIDFDEDSYYDELFFYADYFFYFTDNHEDNIYYLPTELEWTDDLFSKYFVLWGKFFFFWAFILEEAFRVTLAFYISYLIIFEVHAVNVSYSEDSFIASKRN